MPSKQDALDSTSHAYFYFFLEDDREIKISGSWWESLHHLLLFLETKVVSGPMGHSVFRIRSREGEFNDDPVREAGVGHPSLF